MPVVLSEQIQRSTEILQIHPWYDDQEFGSVMAVTRETSNFGEGAFFFLPIRLLQENQETNCYTE